MFISGGEPTGRGFTHEGTTADEELTPQTGTVPEVEPIQEKAQRIFKDIMKTVEKDLGSWVNNRLPLEYDPETNGGIKVLFDKVLQRITFFKLLFDMHCLGLTQNPQTAKSLLESNSETIERLLQPKSEIAACVAFLCHACSHGEVGAYLKEELGKRQELRDLKSLIQSIIKFFGGDQNIIKFFGGDQNIIELFGGDQSIIEFLKKNGSGDPNVESIKIDDSYKVVIQLSPNSAKESSNLTIEYSLDW